MSTPTPREDLKEARKAAGLTQEDLAALIGKSQSVVSRYESGDSAVDIDLAPVLAAALKLGVLDVLYPNRPDILGDNHSQSRAA